jgi:hypothetical protein
MTPKEKAEDLFYEFYDRLPDYVNNEDAKKCAIIAVDEILIANTYKNQRYLEYYVNYWLEVKDELNKL